MGQFNERLFEIGGGTGYPHRLGRCDGTFFEMTDLDLAYGAISQSGLEVIMGALDRSRHQGIIRVNPELDEGARQQLRVLGIGELPL